MSKITIPYVNVAGQHNSIKTELLEAIEYVIDHGNFVFGDELQVFENRFAQLCQARFAIGVNSGTDALILALRVLGIGPGDEVITVPNVFIASVGCIMMVGAHPVFVDVGDDYNINPTQIEEAITSKTKAILPVHWTGRPANMNAITEIAQAHNLPIVEDCAQAVAAEYHGRRVGSFGAIGCFSFHPLKTLSACGDGGALTTNDESLYQRLKLLRNLGLQTRNDCIVWSGNSRLDTLQAAILLTKVKYLDTWTEKRRANAAYYQTALRGVPGLQTPNDCPSERAVYHTFIIRTEQRDKLKRHLANNGVETAVHYPIPIHLQTAATSFGYKSGSFPVSEEQAKQVLSLPIYPELTSTSLDHIVKCILAFYKNSSKVALEQKKQINQCASTSLT